MRRPPSDAEQSAALAQLERFAGSGSPGSGGGGDPASGQTNRLHGRYATLAMSLPANNVFANNTLTAERLPALLLCFSWEIEINQEFADATAHGDYWRVRLPLTQDWTGRVQGYMSRAAAVTYQTAMADAASRGNYQNSPSGTGADPAPMTLTLYNDAGSNIIFQGTCFGQRGRIMAPMAMVTQELELVSAQVPTNGIIGTVPV